MKFIKKVLMGVMCLTIAASMTGFVKANNNKDSAFTVPYSGDGSDVATKARAKKDNTYTYVKLNSGAKFQFWAEGKKGINDGDMGNPFSYDYSTPRHTLSAGKCVYIPNKVRSVKVNGKRLTATYLAISSSDHGKHTYKGVWSPDNLSGFGEK